MAKRRDKAAKILPARLGYDTRAEPRAVTADGIPVFCAHDALIPIEQAVPDPRNPNQHSDAQIAALGNIIQATGWRQPIAISKRSGYIVKGHGRLLAARKKGWSQIPADFQEYASEAEEWADLIADNRLAELSAIDDGLLLDLIRDLGDDVPLDLTGFDQEDVQALIASMETPEEEAVDGGAGTGTEEREDGPVVTRPGDLWILGGHRLLCGDATDEASVERLMRGELADLVDTDPPYGVSYVSPSGRFGAIADDALTGDDLMGSLLLPAFRACVRHTTDDAAFYIWHASSTRREFEDAMRGRHDRRRTGGETDHHLGQAQYRPGPRGLPVEPRAVLLRGEGRTYGPLVRGPDTEHRLEGRSRGRGACGRHVVWRHCRSYCEHGLFRRALRGLLPIVTSGCFFQKTVDNKSMLEKLA